MCSSNVAHSHHKSGHSGPECEGHPDTSICQPIDPVYIKYHICRDTNYYKRNRQPKIVDTPCTFIKMRNRRSVVLLTAYEVAT